MLCGMTGRTVSQLMTNLERIQAKACELARSGKFHGWRPIAFELRFEEGHLEAREWLHNAATQDELIAFANGSRNQARGRLNSSFF